MKNVKDVITVKNRKYARLNTTTFATVEPEIEFLLEDEKFVGKIIGAYTVQVCINNGWGFTVRHEGYRIRFDLQNSTGYKLPRIYEGHILEKLETVQTRLWEG